MYKNITVVLAIELIEYGQSLNYDKECVIEDLKDWDVIPQGDENYTVLGIERFMSEYKTFKKFEKMIEMLHNDLKSKKKIELSREDCYIDGDYVCKDSKYSDLFYSDFMELVEIFPSDKIKKFLNLNDIKTIIKGLKDYYMIPRAMVSFMKEHKIKKCVVVV